MSEDNIDVLEKNAIAMTENREGNAGDDKIDVYNKTGSKMQNSDGRSIYCLYKVTQGRSCDLFSFNFFLLIL